MVQVNSVWAVLTVAEVQVKVVPPAAGVIVTVKPVPAGPKLVPVNVVVYPKKDPRAFVEIVGEL